MPEQAKKAFLRSRDLLSIAEASKLTPYSAEYLSLLARKGSLPAIKIAHNWLTTAVEVAKYVSKQQNRHQSMIRNFQMGRKEIV